MSAQLGRAATSGEFLNFRTPRKSSDSTSGLQLCPGRGKQIRRQRPLHPLKDVLGKDEVKGVRMVRNVLNRP